MLDQSQRLTELIQELFAELPEVVERVDEDAEALANIFRNREQWALTSKTKLCAQLK